MKLPEKPPIIEGEIIQKAIGLLNRLELEPLFQKAINNALYWDKVKYMPLPEDVDHKTFWVALKLFKIPKSPLVFGDLVFNIGFGKTHLKMLHEFDLHFGGTLFSDKKIEPADRNQFLISSLMEEAISSSQIEGAATTRQLAKEMLIQKRKPVDKSDKMIYNNYLTILRIKELVDESLSESMILELQKLITEGTLDNPSDSGRFRENNEVRVVDVLDGSILHQPPDFQLLPKLMAQFYDFCNNENEDDFIHPIIKASILHFLIGYIHPFVDGNGRTARAIFYWYLLKKGYWLTEFLSISSFILKSKESYAKAYIYSEIDNLDLRYFLDYKLKIIKQAYNGLHDYINRKLEEKSKWSRYLKIGGINERQAQLIQALKNEPDKHFTVKEVETRFSIVNQSARTDLKGLETLGIIKPIKINNKKLIFIRVDSFDDLINKIS